MAEPNHPQIRSGSKDLSMRCIDCFSPDGRTVATWDIDGYHYVNLCRSCLLLAALGIARADDAEGRTA